MHFYKPFATDTKNYKNRKKPRVNTQNKTLESFVNTKLVKLYETKLPCLVVCCNDKHYLTICERLPKGKSQPTNFVWCGDDRPNFLSVNVYRDYLCYQSWIGFRRMTLRRSLRYGYFITD